MQSQLRTLSAEQLHGKAHADAVRIADGVQATTKMQESANEFNQSRRILYTFKVAGNAVLAANSLATSAKSRKSNRHARVVVCTVPPAERPPIYMYMNVCMTKRSMPVM
jgi:hypothetical protein